MAEMYPFDPTMTKASNRIVREQHVITSTNFRNYHYVIPTFAPFFSESLSLKLRLPNGQMRDMVEGRDYYLSHQFLDASATTNHQVHGSISFLDTDTEGVLEINYHTIGGQWTLTEAKIIEIMANNLRNPRITSWEFVADVPERFPVVDHPHDIVDFKTMADVQQSIDRVRDAILESSGGGLNEHINNYSNPHQVTKAQVGLGNVQNYGISTTLEAQQGTVNDKYMTPLRTAEAIAEQAGKLVNDHASLTTNPHQVTKAQVGLGSVLNYGISTQVEAEAGTSNVKYMTPLSVFQAIKVQAADPLAAHAARTDNPHNVSKAQIGLFNVENFLIATAQEARDGDRSDRYMTPLRTTQLVQQYVFGALSAHTSDFTNPHNVGKSQVGLGNVDNFATASQSEAVAGVRNDRFMTPLRTADAITALALAPLNVHMNDLENPHQVTKAQVGLGNVPNYPVATQAEAVAGVRTDRLMTPALVKSTVAAVSGDLGAHATATNNPHDVTKAQVGLGNVDNFGTATMAEVYEGTANDKFVTVQGISLLTNPINIALTQHQANTNNPHAVTAAQVGAYSLGETDQLLQGKLGKNDRAADSILFGGMSHSEYGTYLFSSGYSNEFQDQILSEIGANFIGAIETDPTAGTWIHVHAMPYGAAGGGAELRDGFAVVVGGGGTANADFSSVFSVRTCYRGTGSVKVEALSSSGIAAGMRFGYVVDTAEGVINTYFFAPANSGGFRIAEYGNYDYILATSAGTSVPAGFTEVQPSDIWKTNAALTERVDTLENNVSAISQILTGITVL